VYKISQLKICSKQKGKLNKQKHKNQNQQYKNIIKKTNKKLKQIEKIVNNHTVNKTKQIKLT